MSDSAAALGYGVTFAVNTVLAPTVYTAVAEIAEVNFDGFSVPEIKTTHLASPDAMEESIPGLIKPGTCVITGNYTAATSQEALSAFALARTIFGFQIVAGVDQVAGATTKVYTLTGKGFVTKLVRGPFKADAKIDFSATIQVTGAFTETIV